jgi:hypothetical protein
MRVEVVDFSEKADIDEMKTGVLRKPKVVRRLQERKRECHRIGRRSIKYQQSLVPFGFRERYSIKSLGHVVGESIHAFQEFWGSSPCVFVGGISSSTDK